MPTRFCTTPLPPRMLTPAARDQRTRMMSIGMRATVVRRMAENMAARTRGNSVYPMMQTLWANELRIEVWLAGIRAATIPSRTHMFPPSSLICSVTTASPIQTMAKTPLKTMSFWSGWAQKLSSKLSSRQKIRGPHMSQSRRPGVMLF